MSPRKVRPKTQPPQVKTTRPPVSARRERKVPKGESEDDDDDERRRASEAPTLPPPATDAAHRRGREPITSGMRPRKPAEASAAIVDEVTADLSKDPRRER
jgi:hypothetical protein